MKNVVLILISALLISPASWARESLERIVAVVDNNVILASELEQEYQRIVRRLRQSGRNLPPTDILRNQVLEHMIVSEIQLQQAAQRGIRVDETLLNEQIIRVAASQNLSVADFKQQIEASGLDYKDYREGLRKEIITQQLRQRQVYDRIIISDQEVDDYLAQAPAEDDNSRYRLQHILISVPEAASPEEVQEAEKQAQAVFQQLQEGADFAEQAISHSAGQKALEGGELGWLAKAQMPTIFTRAVERLQKGEVAAPIRSPSGFHIIKLNDIQGQERRMVQQTRARHILVTSNAITSDQQAREKVADLRKRITLGESFEDLAKAHSADGSAAQGGDLGWSSPDQFVPPFQKVVDTLPPGKLSEPVHTRFGWHLIEVMERRDYDQTDEYRRNTARRNLHEQKAIEEEELWLRRVRDQAYVDIRLPQAEQP